MIWLALTFALLTVSPLTQCMERAADIQCQICFDNVAPKKIVTLECTHTFCHDCFGMWYQTQKNGKSCGTCKKPVASLAQRAGGIANIAERFEQWIANQPAWLLIAEICLSGFCFGLVTGLSSDAC